MRAEKISPLEALRVVVVVLALASSACTGASFDSAAEADTILTVEDETHDYSSARTYAMPQEVFDLSDFVADPVPPGGEFDDLILIAIADNMAAAGYTRVDLATGDPDVVMTVGKVVQQNWYLYGYWGCWGYPSYWCYYPGYVVPVSYDSGTIVMTLIDPDVTVPGPPDVTLPVVQPVWVGALNGLVTSSIPNTERRIDVGIDQAFAQSPYLTVGPSVPSQPTAPGGA